MLKPNNNTVHGIVQSIESTGKPETYLRAAHAITSTRFKPGNLDEELPASVNASSSLEHLRVVVSFSGVYGRSLAGVVARLNKSQANDYTVHQQ
jgi:hypothetical protein